MSCTSIAVKAAKRPFYTAALHHVVTTWMGGNSLTIVLQFEQTSTMLWSFSSISFFFYFWKLLWYIKKKGQYRKVLIMCWLAGLTLLLLSIFSWNLEKNVTERVFFKVSQTLVAVDWLPARLFLYVFFFLQRAILNAMPVRVDTQKKKS